MVLWREEDEQWGLSLTSTTTVFLFFVFFFFLIIKDAELSPGSFLTAAAADVEGLG